MTAISWIPPGPATILIDTATGNRINELKAITDDFFTRLETLDVTQTMDTGQYVLGTDKYTALGANGSGIVGSLGYRIYRIDDDLAADYPIYIKIELQAGAGLKGYGYSIGSTITVGTSTSGTGAVTGKTASFTNAVQYSNTRSSIPAAYQSFACSVPGAGFLGVVYAPGTHYPERPHIFSPVAFFVERIPNSDGTPSTLGYSLMGINTVYVSGNAYGGVNSYPNVPVMEIRTVLFSGDTYANTAGVPYFQQGAIMPEILIQHAYHSTPSPVRSACVGGIKMPAVSKGSQFETSLYGTAPKNFMCLDGTASLRLTSQANIAPFFLFE